MGNYTCSGPARGFSFTITQRRDIEEFCRIFNARDTTTKNVGRRISEFFNHRNPHAKTNSTYSLSYINLTAEHINKPETRSHLFHYLTQYTDRLKITSNNTELCLSLLRRQDLTSFRFLLNKGAIDTKNQKLVNQWLYWGVYYKTFDVDLIKLCEEYKIPFDQKFSEMYNYTNYSGNVLHMAGEPKNAEAAQKFFAALIKMCPNNLLERDAQGLTPLLAAARGGYSNKFKLLLTNGADLSDLDSSKSGVMHHLLSHWLSARVESQSSRHLLHKGDITLQHQQIWTHLTSLPEHVKHMKMLLETKNSLGKEASEEFNRLTEINYSVWENEFFTGKRELLWEFISLTKGYYNIELISKLMEVIPDNAKHKQIKNEVAAAKQKFMVLVVFILRKRVSHSTKPGFHRLSVNSFAQKLNMSKIGRYNAAEISNFENLSAVFQLFSSRQLIKKIISFESNSSGNFN